MGTRWSKRTAEKDVAKKEILSMELRIPGMYQTNTHLTREHNKGDALTVYRCMCPESTIPATIFIRAECERILFLSKE